MEKPNRQDAEPTLTITDTTITSSATGVYAEFQEHAAADGNGAWVVYGAGTKMGGRLFDRNQAITAMTIAEEKAKAEPDRALIVSLLRELWMEPEAEAES